jgi:hypothetical protein
MYHAHVGMNIIWIHGALIVTDPQPTYSDSSALPSQYFYDEERILILEQLYHEPIETFVDSLFNFTIPRPTTQSLLINGKSFGEYEFRNITVFLSIFKIMHFYFISDGLEIVIHYIQMVTT